MTSTPRCGTDSRLGAWNLVCLERRSHLRTRTASPPQLLVKRVLGFLRLGLEQFGGQALPHTIELLLYTGQRGSNVYRITWEILMATLFGWRKQKTAARLNVRARRYHRCQAHGRKIEDLAPKSRRATRAYPQAG